MTQHDPAVAQIFAGNSEMAGLMRSLDWSQTPLGAVETWAQSLRSALSICLNSRFPIAIYWGKDCLLLYNDAWRPIVGDKHSWALGRPAREVWAEIWDDIGSELASVLATGEGTFHKDDLLSMHRFGYTEECFFEYTFNPIQGEGGVTGGVFNVGSETTYRVLNDRRAQLLREVAAKTGIAKTAEEAGALMVEALKSDPLDIPFALLYLIDPDGKYARLCNDSGYASDRPMSPAVIDLAAADDPSGWSIALAARTLQPQVVNDLVSRFGALPGSPWAEPPQEAMVLPIAAPGQGKASGVLIAVASPRRRLDDHYRDFFAQVAGQIAMAITIAQTYEAERKRAEALTELDRAKTAFFSNVSHEFRTPLTLMLSPLEELSYALHERLQPEEREQLQLVQRNGLRLQKLVNTLLDFSRIEAGRVQASYEPTNLAIYTAELASTFRSLIERAGIQLVIDCPLLPEPVYVDREMWEKIVLNLLSNAFKFTFTGSITVRLHPVGDVVALSVADTGVGISEAELPRLFERFHRVSGTRSRTYEGSGIGLALVQELVKLHGGTIQLTSQVDQGTTFTIAIPFGSAHLPPDRLQSAHTLESTALGAATFVEEAWRWLAKEGNGEWGMGNGEEMSVPTPYSPLPTPSPPHILLADDNADMRDYVKRLLSLHFQVETATNGRTALNAIQVNPPDLVLMDVMMPEMDGFELLRLLRTNPTTQDIPIVLLSARAGEEARIEGLAAGADDYLTKPFSARELLARVEANLKLAQLRRMAIQQEQALRLEAETVKQQVETILSSIRDGFYVLDRDWRFTYVNDRYCKMVAMPRAEILGQTIWTLFPAAVDTDVYVQFQRAMTEQTPLQFEYLYFPWNHWHDHRIYPSPNGLTVFLADITEAKRAEAVRKHAEAELRQKNAILDAVNESAPTPIFVKDREGRIIYANPATLEVLGKAASEVIGYRDCDLYPNLEDAIEVMANDQRVMASGQTEVVEESPDGIRTFLGMKAPYRNEAGEVIGLIGIANDISDRVQLERDRERLLQQEQAAREAAEQANRIKDEFLAVLSHELRSPLNPILGWAKLLRQGKLDEAQTAQALATIERNAELQAQLIEDLLDISRIMQGKLSLTAAPVSLPLVIAAAVETVRLAAEAKNIELQLELDPIAPISGDAARLQQVVWNLLTNAVKFTPHGGQVTVELRQVNQLAQMRVVDTGKGIKPAFLVHMFEYFRQEDGSTTRRFGGLGLGLAIVRQIVEMHGGTVWAESKGEHQGATFIVRLPLSGSRESGVGNGEQPDNPSLPTPHSPLTGLQILLVDDDTDTREFQAFLLEQNGAAVTAVDSGLAALQALEQFTPDVIVSDVGMAAMDGYMLMQHIRSRPLNQGGAIPAIALTAYAAELDQQKALRAGFQAHITKPLEPEVLVKAIVHLLRERVTKL
ncbi:MAG: response regulator [Tildeniella nuda ZEHNDER 1965/U140]|nr:response regulator [Tildeniella nuda ZEHNDER 1965/U140]